MVEDGTQARAEMPRALMPGILLSLGDARLESRAMENWNVPVRAV